MLKFEARENALDIIRNDKVIYTVSDSENGVFPISFGKGENSYSMNHGTFKIKEKIKTKAPCKTEKIICEDERALVYLDIVGGEKCKVMLTIDGDRLKVEFEDLDDYNRMWLRLPATDDEYVYGSGELFSEFDVRGKNVNVWVAEHINAVQIAKKLLKQLVGVTNTTKKQPFEKYETYYAQPTFLSSRKYFFHSLTTARAEFDLTQREFHTIKTDEIAPFYIGFGDSFEEIMTSLTDIVGRQPELPEWVYDGQIIAVQGGTELYDKAIRTAEENELCANGIWIQDWEGRRVTAAGKQLFWNWEWDKELYPELDKRIKQNNEKGIRTLGYINPFLAVEKPLYKEASEKGYCVKDKKGNDYLVKITTFPAAMVDFTNPDAWNWLKEIIKKNMIEFGLSGWMADFGEYLPTDCVLFSGENPELVHNTWPARWAKLNREALEETGKLGEIMFYTRAGYSDTPRYSTMMWCGDNHTDFSIDFGLPSVIPAMLSLSCCGFGLSHSDIGGYTSFFNLSRSDELYMRWCEMNAFTLLMRGHEGLNPDLNAQFDSSKDILRHGSKMAKIHKALKPYLMDAVKYNSETGVGVIRPLFFYYDEPEAFEQNYSYLLGRDILVAPVLRPGTIEKEVYLPDDEWVHLWSGREHGGGYFTVRCDLGDPPVFIRKNAPVLEVLTNTINEIKDILEG
ncbi:MAG: alpha-glucosidase [Eubacterium sp.]|nr:alpha-glucosidase [Eubacterium sp.]